jgi:hypothetical protein
MKEPCCVKELEEIKTLRMMAPRQRPDLTTW